MDERTDRRWNDEENMIAAFVAAGMPEKQAWRHFRHAEKFLNAREASTIDVMDLVYVEFDDGSWGMQQQLINSRGEMGVIGPAGPATWAGEPQPQPTGKTIRYSDLIHADKEILK